MFCPKCGLQNADNIKFCRGCGADLSNVLAVVDGKLSERLEKSENPNDLYSSGIRNLLLGIGFFIISILLNRIPPHDTFFWLLLMFPAFSLIASGISRIVKANGIKSKNADVIQPNSFPANQPHAALPPVQTEYINPSKSIYETDDLVGQPLSVTEPTTRHLKMDSEGETMTLPKK
jgi:hypothetical protein